MSKIFNKKIVVIGTVSIILLVGGGKRFISRQNNALDHIAAGILYPVLVTQRAIINPLKHFFERRKSYQELQSQLHAAHVQRDALLAENITLRSTHLFFDDVQELIDFKKRYDTSTARIAQVLLKNISPQEHFFLVDAGAAQGIECDMVAVWKNCLIGRVIEVYRWYSKVMLITDQSCQVAARTAAHGTIGIYRGCNAVERASLDHVSHLATIERDELVLSSGEGLIFPRGFVLGTINSHIQGPLFYTIEIKLMIDIEKLQYCYLIKKES